jgi:hypothetical protein
VGLQFEVVGGCSSLLQALDGQSQHVTTYYVPHDAFPQKVVPSAIRCEEGNKFLFFQSDSRTRKRPDRSPPENAALHFIARIQSQWKPGFGSRCSIKSVRVRSQTIAEESRRQLQVDKWRVTCRTSKRPAAFGGA